MIFYAIIRRIILLAIGYMTGIIQTGYIFGKTKKLDIRNYGSGNAGTTNALRVMGAKAGLIVFIGDFLKSFIPCIAVLYIFRNHPGYKYTYMLYIGFGTVLGHDFPFYLNFKGGKGVASTAGVLTALDVRIMAACLVVFLATVIKTRFVSLASILVMFVFVGMCFIFSHYRFTGLDTGALVEFRILSAAIGVLSIYRHKENIKRLINGSENKLFSEKKQS